MSADPLLLIYPAHTRLVALPAWNSPRVVFEAGPWAGRWSAAGHLDAYSRRGRLQRNVLRCAAMVMPGRVPEGDADSPSLVRFVNEMGVEFRRSVVLVGRADHRQKWTMICLGDGDRPVAYVKYGEKEAAQKQVVYEGNILRDLPVQWGPEPMRVDRVAGGVALLMRPVEGQAITKRPLSPVSQHAVMRLVERGISAQPSCQGARGALHPAMTEREWPEALRPSLDVLADTPLPVGWQHGDLTPWNIRIDPSGGVTAIDWEDARRDGCPWFDLVYYVIQTHHHLMGSRMQAARRDALRWLCVAGHGSTTSDALLRVAACDAWLRWRANGWPDEHPSQRFRQAVWSNIP
jgi:hypothetical protein